MLTVAVSNNLFSHCYVCLLPLDNTNQDMATWGTTDPAQQIADFEEQMRTHSNQLDNCYRAGEGASVRDRTRASLNKL